MNPPSLKKPGLENAGLLPADPNPPPPPPPTPKPATFTLVGLN